MAIVEMAKVMRALREMSSALGDDRVFFEQQDRDAYSDQFSWEPERHMPGGVVAPESQEEVRAAVTIANNNRVPIWPISRGKNLGYGSAAPVMAGSIVMDLSRMKKIEVDEENGTVLLEPGVGFFDLYDHLRDNNIPLWLSVPGNSWGSVVGNALDRGVGYTDYGDHAARICGVEMVLANGEVVRTGTGAMSNSSTWQLYKPGFGPSWDTMLCQSNFGVITKVGMWLMREPQAVAGFDIECDKPEDLEWLIDTLAPLRRDGIIQQTPSIGNWLRSASPLTTRDQWAEPGVPLSQSAIDAIRTEFNVGYWSVSTRMYGAAEVVEAKQRVVAKAFENTSAQLTPSSWKTGDDPEGTPWTGVPITFPLSNTNWFGGRGGHLGFSPVMPARGDVAMKLFNQASALFDEYGFDYHPSFAIGERHMTNVNQILFDRDNAEMTSKIDPLFRQLVTNAADEGYSEYRAHIDYMDLIASTFDFGDGALRRMNEKVKDALDPNGIIAPGKSGIRAREQRGTSS